MGLHHVASENLVDIARDHSLVTMGITPSGSGDLHSGHYVTLFGALKAINEHPALRGIIYVDDREYHNQKHPGLPKEEVTARLEAHLQYFLGLVGGHFHNTTLVPRVSVRRVSECMRDEGVFASNWGGDLLGLAAGHPDLLSKHYDEVAHFANRPVLPVCPTCKDGNLKLDYYDLDQSTWTFTDECHNLACSSHGDTYQVKPNEGDTDWTVFYALIGFRDVMLAQKESVLHVYGGDYGKPWGTTAKSKAERMHGMTRDLMRERGGIGEISHYVGPLLTNQGRKLAKRHGDSIDALKIDCELIDRIIESRQAIVDYK